MDQSAQPRNAPQRARPALKNLIAAMERLPRYQRREIVRLGCKARAAKAARLRRLAREARAEAVRLARETAH